MIFLGAGASKIFGIKTLQEMSKDLTEIMEKKGYSDIVGKITKGLERFGIPPDFEAIYVIVEGLTNILQTVKKSGSFTAYVCRDLKELEPQQDLKDLLKVFRSFIYEECKLKRDFIEKICPVYDKLFEILKDSGKKETRWLPKHGANALELTTFPVGIDDTIVTTNYDMIIESYHRIKRQQYADGFGEVEGDPNIKRLDLTTYSSIRQRWLIKLHGSIYEYTDGKSVFKATEDPEKFEIPVEIEEKMMVFPTNEKPILRAPYYGFYDVFRTQKWAKLIAIGYSFRDDPVNIAILENLEKVEHSILIVVNPNAEKVIQNLGASALPKFDDRIIPVQGKFGDEEVFQNLMEALKVESKKRYEERKLERLKGATLY